MPNPQSTDYSGETSQPALGRAAGTAEEISPELLEKVIERVYQLLLQELAVEQERCGYMGRAMGDRSGGW